MNHPRLASLALFAVGLIFLPVTVEAGERPVLLPSSWGGSASFGYGWNLLGSSRAERDGFESGDPDYLFVVNRLDDGAADLGLWARWDVPSFYKKLRIRAGAQAREWANVSPLRSSRYDLGLRQKLGDGSQLDLSLRYEPQVYLRHRVDKDALPGAPRFRPEAYRGTEVGLAATRPLGPIGVGLFGGFENQRRTPWFRERDETTWSGGASLRLPLGDIVELVPLAGLARTHSRNRPDLGSDRSHREGIAGLRATLAPAGEQVGWRIEAGTKWKFRTYTTGDPTDDSRYGRHDRIYSWSALLARSFAHFTPFAQVEGSGRLVDLPPGANPTADEEGEYQGTFARAGIDWQF